MAYSLPLSASIETAWQRVYGAKGPIMLGFILQIIMNIKTDIAVIDLLFALTSSLLSVGLIYMGIIRARNLPINYSLIFSGFTFHTFLNLLGFISIAILASVVMVLSAVFISWYTLLIFTPAFIFLGLRTFLTLSFIVDRRLSIIPALKASYFATQGNVWRIILLSLFMMLVVIAGLIPLGIGLIWAVPFCYILWGVIYENLVQNHLDGVNQAVVSG